MSKTFTAIASALFGALLLVAPGAAQEFTRYDAQGYSFAVPAGWTAEWADPAVFGVADVVQVSNPATAAVVHVMRNPTEVSLTADQLVEAKPTFDQGFAASLGEGSSILSSDILDIPDTTGNTKALLYTFQKTAADGSQLYGVQAWHFAGGNHYIVQSIGSLDALQDGAFVVGSIVGSFVIGS